MQAAGAEKTSATENNPNEATGGCPGFGAQCVMPDVEPTGKCAAKGCGRKLHHFCITESFYLSRDQREADQGRGLCFKCATGEEPSDHPSVPLRCSDPKGEDDLFAEDPPASAKTPSRKGSTRKKAAGK